MDAFIFPTLVDNILSLEEQVRLAVGSNCLYNISPEIPFAKLKRAKRIGRKMLPRMVPYILGETPQKAAARLVNQGFILGDMAELAQVTAQYPEDVKKYKSVFALHEYSRWSDEGTRWRNRFKGSADMEPLVFVPYCGAEDHVRWFRRFLFDRPLDEDDAVLVFEKIGYWP